MPMMTHQDEGVEEIAFELSPSPMLMKETRTPKDFVQDVSETSFVNVERSLNKSWDIEPTVDETIDLLQDQWEKNVNFEQNDEDSNFSTQRVFGKVPQKLRREIDEPWSESLPREVKLVEIGPPSMLSLIHI